MLAEASPSQTPSVWSPLRHSVFRALWIASIVSNIGSWMQDVGESWLMTSLTLSPVLVALVETALTWRPEPGSRCNRPPHKYDRQLTENVR